MYLCSACQIMTLLVKKLQLVIFTLSMFCSFHITLKIKSMCNIVYTKIVDISDYLSKCFEDFLFLLTP